MELEKKVMELLKEAMKAKDDASMRALRAIKGALIIAKTDKGFTEMTPEKELQIVQKLAKQRKESFDVYTKQGLADLAQKEKEELDVLETFLPKQMSEKEIKPIVQEIISSLGVTDIKGMGQVIGAATKKLAGQADGAVVSKIVRELLS